MEGCHALGLWKRFRKARTALGTCHKRHCLFSAAYIAYHIITIFIIITINNPSLPILFMLRLTSLKVSQVPRTRARAAAPSSPMRLSSRFIRTKWKLVLSGSLSNRAIEQAPSSAILLAGRFSRASGYGDRFFLQKRKASTNDLEEASVDSHKKLAKKHGQPNSALLTLHGYQSCRIPRQSTQKASSEVRSLMDQA